MILELAVGDAYGAGFEYVSDRLISDQNNLRGYVQHPRHAIRPGCYTDDTQMTLAIAEALVSGEAWTPAHLAERFVAVFKRDPRIGYASRFHDFLESVSSGAEFLARVKPDSAKSGAAMRAGPLGFVRDTREMLDKCKLQAAITHNTPAGIQAACGAALMTHYFVHRQGPKAELAAYVQGLIGGNWLTPWKGKVGHCGTDSVHAAMTSVLQHSTLSGLLKACVDWTGDVDTVATIALAAAACSDEFEKDLPDCLITGLEAGAFGRPYLIELDVSLCRVFGAKENSV